MARFFAVTPKREVVRSPNTPATFAAARKIPPRFQFASTFLRRCHFPARGCRCYNLLVAGRGGVISKRSRLGFITHKRRYGAGVSTSGSQPENPGSIPGTATKLSRLVSSATHGQKKPGTSHQIAKRHLLLDNPESCFALAPSVIVTSCHQSKIWNVPAARPHSLPRRRRLSVQNAKVLSTSVTTCNFCAESPRAMPLPAMPPSLPGPACGVIVPFSRTRAPSLSARAGLRCSPAAAIPMHS
jgi:hypothetical protein